VTAAKRPLEDVEVDPGVRLTNRVSPERVRKTSKVDNARELFRQTRGQGLADALAHDTSDLALRPTVATLPSLCASLLKYVDDAYSKGTIDAERGHWNWWTAYCDYMGTKPFRTCVSANMGTDAALHQRECLLQALFVPWVLCRMQPRSKKDAAPKPESAMKVLAGVRRIHKKEFLPMAPLPMVQLVLRGILRWYVDEYGQESLMPDRKEPLKRAVQLAMVQLPQGTKFGKVTVGPNQTWTMLIAVLTVMCVAGFRKVDVALSRGQRLTKKHISRAHVSWRLRGTKVTDPSREQLLGITRDDAMLLLAPPGKCDITGAKWGGDVITVPFRDHALNAAAALRNWEVANPCCDDALRRDTHLFDVGGRPLTGSSLDALLQPWLAAANVPAEEAANYSWHSPRSFLASSLKELGAEPHVIQQMCRWETLGSTKIYARPSIDEYTYYFDRLDSTRISGARANHVQLDASERMAPLAGFDLHE
jgi:hypothetical protein